MLECADINQRDDQNELPLNIALEKLPPVALKAFINKRPDLLAYAGTENNEVTPLMALARIADFNQQANAIEIIMTAYDKATVQQALNSEINSLPPLLLALDAGRVNIVEYFVKAGASLDVNVSTKRYLDGDHFLLGPELDKSNDTFNLGDFIRDNQSLIMARYARTTPKEFFDDIEKEFTLSLIQKHLYDLEADKSHVINISDLLKHLEILIRQTANRILVAHPLYDVLQELERQQQEIVEDAEADTGVEVNTNAKAAIMHLEARTVDQPSTSRPLHGNIASLFPMPGNQKTTHEEPMQEPIRGKVV